MKELRRTGLRPSALGWPVDCWRAGSCGLGLGLRGVIRPCFSILPRMELPEAPV